MENVWIIFLWFSTRGSGKSCLENLLHLVWISYRFRLSSPKYFLVFNTIRSTSIESLLSREYRSLCSIFQWNSFIRSETFFKVIPILVRMVHSLKLSASSRHNVWISTRAITSVVNRLGVHHGIWWGFFMYSMEGALLWPVYGVIHRSETAVIPINVIVSSTTISKVMSHVAHTRCLHLSGLSIILLDFWLECPGEWLVGFGVGIPK